MPPEPCKPSGSNRRRCAGGRRRLWAAAGTLASLSACSAPQRTLTIHVLDLESAPAAATRDLGHFALPRGADWMACSKPLNRRLRLVELPAERLAEVEALPPLPVLPAGGMVVGVLDTLGQPLEGVSPLEIKRLRMVDGAGLLEVELDAATYLPDATSYAHLIYVSHPTAVLVVDVNDARFYPDSGPVPASDHTP